MDIERFRSAWRDQPVPAHLIEEDDDMIESLERRMKLFHRKIVFRDAVETLAALFVVAVFAWVSRQSGSGLAWAGTVVAAAAAAGIAIRLGRARRAEAGSAAHDLRSRLHGEIDAVERQIHLLRTVARWYVLPLMLGGFLWSVGLILAATEEIGIHSTPAALVAVAVVALWLSAVGWLVWRVNRKAARDHLEPLRSGLLDSLRRLEAGGDDQSTRSAGSPSSP
ncbi:MAG: hypothetical protein R2991_10930 [Thermoanaerobaculia bacterium]